MRLQDVRVGLRVRVVKLPDPLPDGLEEFDFVGKLGTVAWIERDREYPIGVRLDDVRRYEWVPFLPDEFIQTLPYITTLVVLAVFYRRVRPPKAVGQAYESGAPA